MRLIEHKCCYILEDIFPPPLLAGFTKKDVEGKLPTDIQKVLPFLKRDCKISYLTQPHSPQINFVTKEGVYEGDGLFTKKDSLVLVVRTADCLPLFFYSREAKLIGIVHMGWRSAREGILDRIGGVMRLACSEKMESNLRSFKVIAGIGLRECCYEVGEEFLDFPNLAPYISERKGQLYFNPIGFARDALIRGGLRKDNFFDVNICSFCSKKKFYSFRRAKTTLRTLSFIVKQ
ncbi:MAG: polyphenol oxidase family protein [Candidatus Omnitrophota bacterium]|nr:MAG: polyphenol oxidase family protein [Candidatus Omnitrophota bacterium]